MAHNRMPFRTILAGLMLAALLLAPAIPSAAGPPPPPVEEEAGTLGVDEVQAATNLAISKEVAPTSPTAGDVLTYTLTAVNLGAEEATGVVVTDNLPGALSYTGSTSVCTYLPGPHQLTCPVGSLGASGTLTDTLPVTLTGQVDPAATGNLVNQASVVHDSTDPDLTNNTDTLTSTVQVDGNLALTMADTPDPVSSGAALTYTLSLTNTGPSVATGVTLTDTLPATTGFLSTTPADKCSHSAGSVICSFATLAAAEEVPIEVVVQVGLNETGPLNSSAEVTSASPDSQSANNTAAETTQVVQTADLELTKNDAPDPVVAGTGVLTYTLTATNLGPSLAAGVSVIDTLPGQVTLLSSAASQGNCSQLGVTVSCSLGDLPPMASGLITLTVSVPAGATSPLVNNALANAATTDPDTGNNSASTSTQVIYQADLSLSKADLLDPVAAGAALTYTLTITNGGPSTATGVVLTDTLPAGVTYLSAVPGQGSCSPGAGMVTCDLLDLAIGATTSVELVVGSDPGASGTLLNQAQVASQEQDPAPGDNTANETTDLTASADLQLTKQDSPDALPEGTVLTYTLQVLNQGPSDAANVVLTDTLPAEVILNSAGASQGSCTSGPIVECDLGAIPASSSATAELLVTVLPGTPMGSITNTAVVSTDTPDPALGNNTAVELTLISDQVVDLSLAKTDDPDPVLPGQPLTYTLQVSNAGPSGAGSVVLTDTLPAGVTFVSAAPSQGTCTPGSTVVCDLEAMPAGSSAAVTVVVDVEASTSGDIVNTAVVTSDVAESNEDDNTVQETTTVVPQADLSLAKVDHRDPTVANGALVYTLTVRNEGPSLASGITLTDTLPAEVSYQSSSPGSIPCQEASGVVTCELGDLPAGGQISVALQTLVAPGFSGMITNQATVGAATADPKPSNNSTTENTTVFVDSEPPTVDWVLPVITEGVFEVGDEVIRLEVDATDNFAVESVRFKRWDPNQLIWITLGVVTTPGPSGRYGMDFDTSSLLPRWNEVRAETRDAAGNVSEPRILLFHFEMVYLPIISRQ